LEVGTAENIFHT